MGSGKKNLFVASGSHYQDGRDTPIYRVKTLQNLLNQCTNFQETWYVAYGIVPNIVCSNNDPGLTLTCFTARSNFVN